MHKYDLKNYIFIICYFTDVYHPFYLNNGRECQRRDWEFHRRNCVITPTVIGLPSVLVIPESKLSMRTLSNEAFKLGM